MRTTKILTLFLSFLVSILHVRAQDKWDLLRCVNYALANNISIKQADIDSRTAKLTLDQSKWTQYGTATGSTSLGFNFGRSINQTTNIYTNTEGRFTIL